MKQTALFELAQRFVGKVNEIPGSEDHPLIQWFLSLCGFGLHAHDETAWCSAFVNAICFLDDIPRSKSAAARSWLKEGVPIPLINAQLNDVVVLKRGTGPQPGPEVLDAPGHVGFFAGLEDGKVIILGGNQGNQVSLAHFPADQVLSVRRLG
jgi:uncharacterized protein (TIGR02594 family)